MKQVAVGIDIGGTNTVYGIVDKEGNCLFKDNLATYISDDARVFVAALSEKIKNSVADLGVDVQLMGIGIGAPNGNFYKGTIDFAPNLSWKGIVPLVDYFKEHFNVPVFLTNDANAAAIGEMIYGGARDIKNFIMITLGTGLGSGIVVNGQLVYGHDGFAGEIGHVIVKDNGRQCGCGRRGCLETYCSAPGIKRTAFEMMLDSNEKSALHEYTFKKLNSKIVAEAAQEGDELALKVFNLTGKILGKALANAVAYTSPEAIFIFGGPAQAGELIFEPTRRYLEKNLLQIYKNKVKVLPSELPIGNAAIVGASALVWNEID
ncbi:MAG: ROK family protein [Bacteroidales bacterium]|nr:ROK family protein [Bacteroidales bacterium]MCF8456381.1 ROK family protein [Bacteroidales bacterium]